MPRILLVEDNEMNRDMLVRRLLRKGFEMAVAVDGLQGVAQALAEPPDLVLMDMSLPGIDGWEATRRLKADGRTRAVPVIALTAHAMSDDRSKALAAGCDDFDTKPVDLDRLLGKIQALLAAGPASDPAPLWATDLTLPAVPQSLPALQAAVDALCTQAGADGELRADLQVVLDEVCSNVFAHAHALGTPGPLRLLLRHWAAASGSPAALELSFIDHGRPFDPLAAPRPDLDLPLDERPIGGLGIHLLRQLTDRQLYRHSAVDGNCLSLFKHLR